MAVGDKKPVVMGYEKAVPGGVATLGPDGKLEEAQRPAVDDTPVKGSDNPVKSGGVYDALFKKQDTLTGTAGQLIGIGGDGTAQATVYPSNRSLLDNGCLVNPVNQRGETEYVVGTNEERATRYTIDRYILEGMRPL